MNNKKTRITVLSILMALSIIYAITTIINNERHLYRLKEPLEPTVLAKTAVEKFLLEEKLTIPAGVKNVKNLHTGVFVTISNKKTGLRGCLGTTPFDKYSDNTAKEIVYVAIASAINDKRFKPVSKDELKELFYSVDVLEKPQDITSQKELDPKKYGILVFSGIKRGILLPDIKKVDSVEEQIKYAKINGKIKKDAKIDKIQKFTVQRF